MATIDVGDLAGRVNDYTVASGPPKQVTVANLSRLARLGDVTVSGVLLKKQLTRINASGTRTRRLAGGDGYYDIEAGDGDLHFCLGTAQLGDHVACELQNAEAWLDSFRQAVGRTITVSGFFRCLFEHPGFSGLADAHIFEIHPVRAVDLGQGLQAFDVDIPDQDSIHTWREPFDLNKQDGRIQATYDTATDSVTFSNMDGKDENYVHVIGSMSRVWTNDTSVRPAHFMLQSEDITPGPVRVYCLQGTKAVRQLRMLHRAGVTDIDLIGLRNIDLGAAKESRYVIDMLGISIVEQGRRDPRSLGRAMPGA